MYVPSEKLYERLWEFCDAFYSESKRKEDDKSMSNPNNKAPKEMEGTYTLTIEDNKIKLVDKEGNVGMARCHPDDEFSLEVGMKEAFAKLEEDKNKIKVGDMVEVVYNGLSYTTYVTWLENNLKFKEAVKYDYGCRPHKGTNGVVFAVAKHTVEDKGLRKVAKQ